MSNPWRGPLMLSLGSTPGGDSILITSAPKSANCFTQVGPARTRDRSRMRNFASALDAGRCGMVVQPVIRNDRCQNAVVPNITASGIIADKESTTGADNQVIHDTGASREN